MNAQSQGDSMRTSTHPASLPSDKGGLGSTFKMLIFGVTILGLLIIEYAALAYLGNPIFNVTLFIAIIELILFAALLTHILAILISGLKINEYHFILPHPGIRAITDGGPKKILFKDIDIAYYHQSRKEKDSQLRIKLSDGSAISFRQGDLGIKPDNFDELIKQLGARHKLDTEHFNS